MKNPRSNARRLVPLFFSAFFLFNVAALFADSPDEDAPLDAEESVHNQYRHFQRSKLINLHSSEMEWQKLSRIRDGVNMPTGVQTISASEAFFYGFSPKTPDLSQKGTFFRPFLRLQPFFTAWNNVDTERGTQDFATRKRLSLDDEVLTGGVDFGSRSFYGSLQIGLSTIETIKHAGSSESSSGYLGFWQPNVYGTWFTAPQEAYLSWAWEHASFAAGRFKTGIGFGEENLILNGQAVWYDNVQFSWWNEKFKFFTMIGASSSHLSDAEWEVQQYDWDTINNHDATVAGDDGMIIPFKMFTYHRIEWKPFSRLGLALTEMQLVGGKMPDLTNFLPAVIWHNTYTAGVTNVMFQVDAWALPAKGLFVYGEFLIDDMLLSGIESSDAKPRSLGWELGALYTLPVNVPGWIFFVSGEYTHVDEWTYTRWQPYLSMYQRQVATGGWHGLDTPLGHSEGGDVDTFAISVGAVTDKGARFELGYKYIIKGPVYINQLVSASESGYTGNYTGSYVPVYYDTVDAEGADKKSHCIMLEGAWPFLNHFKLSASVDLRYVINANHVDGKKAFETIFKMGLLMQI